MSAPGDNLPLVTGMLEALTDRVRAEREGRLRAEARVRALEEALGEALEASRDPRAERAIAALREIREYCESLYRLRHADAEYRPDDGVLAVASSALWSIRRHGFGGGL